MQVAARSRRLTLGVSLATASVLAVSPLAVSTPVTSLSASPAISSAAVRLAADYNPLQPWIDAFQTASASAKQIGDTFLDAPAVLLQQFLANQAEHLDEVLKNPGSIGTVLGQVVHNVQAAILTSTLLGYNQDRDGYTLSQQVLDGWHEIMRQSIPKILPEGTPPQAKELIQQVLNVLSSPLSGVAMGVAGPLISPVVALVNSLHNVVTAMVAGDFTAAVQNVINIPANIVGAALNGANLNLDGLVPVLNQMGLLAPGNTLHNLNIQFGGLFSTGVTGVFEDGIGGSIFNAIGLNTTTNMMGFPLTVEITGRAIGPIAALVTLGQFVAKAIGWDGSGNPLVPVVEQPAGIATAGEPAAELVSESPSAIPSATTSALSLKVSSETAAGATSASESTESTADESASGAKADDASADDEKSGSVGDADDEKAGSVGDTDDEKSGSVGDADDEKAGSVGAADDEKSAGKSVTAKNSTAGEGGADSGATSRAASDSQE